MGMSNSYKDMEIPIARVYTWWNPSHSSSFCTDWIPFYQLPIVRYPSSDTSKFVWIVRVNVSVILDALWVELWITDISWILPWTSLAFKRRVIELINNNPVASSKLFNHKEVQKEIKKKEPVVPKYTIDPKKMEAALALAKRRSDKIRAGAQVDPRVLHEPLDAPILARLPAKVRRAILKEREIESNKRFGPKKK